MMSATGRKYLRGPRGTGFLYVRNEMLDRLVPTQPDSNGANLEAGDRYEWVDGARRFDYWEHSVASWLGLGAAVDHALGWGLDRIQATVQTRADELRAMLVDIGFVVYDEGTERCGIVTAANDRVPSDELQALLARNGVNTDFTHPGSSRWDVERGSLPPLLRLSVHYTTTSQELQTAIAVLATAH